MLLGIPYLLTQVPLTLVDVPTMFFLMLAVYTFLLAVRSGGAARMACSAAAIVLTVLAKYSAWFMLTVLIVVDCRIRAGPPVPCAGGGHSADRGNGFRLSCCC